MIEKKQTSKKEAISLDLSENGYTYSFLILQNRQSLYAYIRKLFEDTVIIRHDKNELELSTKTSDLIAISNFLKNHTLLNFKQLIEIAVIDRPNKINRFKLNYVLFSPLFNTRIIISTEVKEIDILSSLVKLYKSAEWLEREVWDLYGIHFEGNSDLRRIITDYGFKGHPLRKDFPLTGFLEIYYNDEEKKIVYEPVELAQDYRVFHLWNPWSSALKKNDNPSLRPPIKKKEIESKTDVI